MPETLTCDLGGYTGGYGWAEAFVGAGFQSEVVCGARIQPNEEMMCLILEFEDPATLCCQICTGVQGAKSLIGDLMKETSPFDYYNDNLHSLFTTMMFQTRMTFHKTQRKRF